MNDFYLASVPEPVTLLGLRLRPFSLGHKLLLHRVESVFVCGGEITHVDLALSVFICALRYNEACEAFNDRRLPRFMARWHAKLTGDTRIRRWLGIKPKPVDLKEKAEAFENYMAAGSKMPYFSYEDSRSGAAQLESVHAVKLSLLSKTTLTELELMDRPWGLCLFDFVGLQAMENKVTLRERSDIHDALDVANRIAAKLAQANGHLRNNS